MSILFGAIFLLVCFLIVSLVLLQEGKGGGLAAMGAGSMDSVMGVKNPLRRWTAYLFIAFVVIAVGINKYYSMQAGGDIPEGIEVAEEAPAAEPGGAGEIEILGDAPDEADIAREVSGALGRQPGLAPEPETEAETPPPAPEAPTGDEEPETEPETTPALEPLPAETPAAGDGADAAEPAPEETEAPAAP